LSDPLRPTYDFPLGDLAREAGPRADIFRSILPGSRVLDVGCDTGRLGQILSQQKGAVVHGMERDPAAAAEARGRLAEVWQRPVDAPDSFTGLGPYDVVLFLDVLEHLFDPWDVLRRAAHVLRPGGVVHALVPNIAHVSVVRRLVQGRFEYADFGTMDRTHVRWFTRSSIERCFEESGLEHVTVAAVPLVPHVDSTRPWGERVSRLLAYAWPDAFGGSLHAVGYAPSAR
jgi:2-polyprenyl-3-methyl-5-hydroxy-6-metoxy-1,4-benzoquinol methylase